MTTQYFPFDAGAGSSVTEAQWTLMARLWRLAGVIPSDEGKNLDALEVYADSTGLHVKAKSGEAWIQGHYFQSDSVETIPLVAAHATLNRYDLIVAELDWANNTIALSKVTGTPSSSPSVPSPTRSSTVWQLPLASVLVDAGATSIPASKVTDMRQYSTQKRVVTFQWTTPAGTLSTGSSRQAWPVPKDFNRWRVVGVQAHVATVSTSGKPTFQIRRVRPGASDTNILSTALTIDANEKDSMTADVPAVIDTSANVILAGDELHIDVTAAGTGAKGATVFVMLLP